MSSHHGSHCVYQVKKLLCPMLAAHKFLYDKIALLQENDVLERILNVFFTIGIIK